MKSFVAGALLGLASLSAAQESGLVRSCATQLSDLCYSVNVPDATASSGSGDIFFQLRGPDSLEFMALGQGSMMAGANIFVVYHSADGQNVTLSPRSGTGHVMPQFNDQADVELLEGSGIVDGFMVANVRCGNCLNWGAGELDISSTEAPWIYSYRQGEPLMSDDQSARISQHSQYGFITFDMTTAQGGDSTNPFAPNAAAGGPAAAQPTGNIGSEGTEVEDASMNITPTLLTAHGVIMGLVFVLLFPSGVFIRAFVPSSSIWVHAGVQTLAWLLAIAGMGIGIHMAIGEYLSTAHAIIGILTVSLISFQPLGGILQHMHYKKHGNRSMFGWGHRFAGIALITLGIINGGLGLQLADNTRSGTIAYGVLAGIFGLAMLGAFALSSVRSSGPINVDRHEPSKEGVDSHNGDANGTNGTNGH